MCKVRRSAGSCSQGESPTWFDRSCVRLGRNVLVLGNGNRASLAVVRSLGHAGLCVHLGTSDKHSICRYSKYVKKTYLLPSSLDDNQRFAHALSAILRANPYSLVIPVSDPYMAPVMKYYELLKDLGAFAVPSRDNFHASYDKRKTMRVADACGVPYPETAVVSTKADLDTALAKATYPAVVKPVSSILWLDNQGLGQSVRFAYNQKELRPILESYVELGPVLLQEAVTGIGVGQEFLALDGRIIAAFQHERLYELSKGPGGSYYRKSTRLDPELLSYSRGLIAELNWTGVLMIEYKWDLQSERKYLMEINGRFWGSLPLAIVSGVDFPSLLFDLLVDKKKGKPPSYRTGVFCRNFKDFYRIARKTVAGVSSKPHAIGALGQFREAIRNIGQGREFFDAFLADDFTPGILDLPIIMAPYVSTLFGKVRSIVHRSRYKKTLVPSKPRLKRVLELIRITPRILILCSGNVIRSPFAGAYLSDLLRRNDLAGIDLLTAGLCTRHGRKAHPYARIAAEAEGLSLSNHRSVPITDELIDWSVIILVMDLSHFRRVERNFRKAIDKTFLLGMFHDGNDRCLEIMDPYGCERERFLDVFDCIKTSCVRLVDLLRGTPETNVLQED